MTAEQASLALTPTPERDRLWADAIRVALSESAMGQFVPPFERLTCAHSVSLTNYCMTGCPSNALRWLMAIAEGRKIPGLVP